MAADVLALHTAQPHDDDRSNDPQTGRPPQVISGVGERANEVRAFDFRLAGEICVESV